jgi:hypothetical protein
MISSNFCGLKYLNFIEKMNTIDEFKDEYSQKAFILLICTNSQTFVDYLAEIAFQLPPRHTVFFVEKLPLKVDPPSPLPVHKYNLYRFQMNVSWLQSP